MGSEVSIAVIVVSVIVVALVIFFAGRKYAKSGEKVVSSLKATNDRVTVLESVVTKQGAQPKIGELQASKLPLSSYRGSVGSSPPPLPKTTHRDTQVQNDPTPALIAMAALSSDDSSPSSSSSGYSSSCGSSSSSDSGSSYDSSSSCSSSSDSY